jgi:general secretion pathway protein D
MNRSKGGEAVMDGGEVMRTGGAMRARLGGAALALVVLLLTTACGTSRAFQQGEKAFAGHQFDRAVLYLSRAVAAKPSSTRYRVALARARFAAAEEHFRKAEAYHEAGQLEPAIAEYQQVVYLAPSHQFAANELSNALAEWQAQQASQESEMEAMKRRLKDSPGRAAPRLKPGSNIPIVLRFKNETTEKIYDALSKASGINFIFDDRLDLNKKISIDIADVTFAQALNQVLAMNKHFFKIWDESTIMIAEDTPQKHKELDDLVIQTFYLSNADVKDVQVLLRTLLDARQIAQNDRLNAITIRDTPERVEVAQKIIESNDKAKSELVIDIELLEVNRTMLQSLGIDLFGPEGGTGKSMSLQYGGGNSVTLNNLDLLKQKGSWLLGPIPGVVVNFLKTDGDAQVIARPQLRVSEGEKAAVRIGDRIPIPTTTFNAAPTVGGTVGVPITSFTYQNVGINIDLEPRVHHNREITLKAKVEISSLAGQVSAGGGLTQPIIGTREIDTTIRLKDGETNLLAGLIREEERRSLSGVPGLSDIPVLKRLFGTTETNVQKVDIVLTLTPHIIRIPDIREDDLLPLWIGTEQNIALRGTSRQSAYGNMFEEQPEPPTYPGIPDFTIEEAAAGGTAVGAGAAGGDAGGEVPGGGTEGVEVDAPPRPDTPPPPPDEGAEPGTGDDNAPSGPAIVNFDPSYLGTAPGQEFGASVVISGATGVGSVPFHLEFDPEILEFLGADQTSPFLSRDGTQVFVLATLSGNGREVIVGLSRQGNRPGIDGQGTLIQLRFRARKSGTTTLNFSNLSVLDPNAQPLPYDKLGMTVVVQ